MRGERRHKRTTLSRLASVLLAYDASPLAAPGARALADRPLNVAVTTVAVVVIVILPLQRYHVTPATSGLTSVTLVLTLETPE